MSKADFYGNFSEVVNSETYESGVYALSRPPAKAKRFLVDSVSIQQIVERYMDRILALLDRWREGLEVAEWATTKTELEYQEGPMCSCSYSWRMNAVFSDQTAHIAIMLEPEGYWEEEGGFYTVQGSASIDFGPSGSDQVKLDVPNFEVLIDDEHSFEEKFQSFEQVTGEQLLQSIEQHLDSRK